jgi:hypothetical protein
MRSGLWKDFVDEKPPSIPSYLGRHAQPVGVPQSGYAQGLVGQLPYQMGFMAMKTLRSCEGGLVSEEIIRTNVLTHILKFSGSPRAKGR